MENIPQKNKSNKEEEIPQQGVVVTQEADKKKQSKKGFKLFRRIIYLLLWTVVILNLFNYNLLDKVLAKILPENTYLILANYYFYLYILLFVAVLLIFRIRRIIFYFFGFIFLPVNICLIFIPKYSFKAIFSVLSLMLGTVSMAASFKYRIIMLCLFILSVAAIFDNPHKTIVILAMVILFYSLLSHYVKRFHTIARPVRIINSLKEFLFKGWNKIKTDTLQKNIEEWKQLDSDDEQYSQKRMTSLSSLWMINRIFYRLANYLKRSENYKAVAIYFIISVIYTFVYTIIIFALEYYALNNISSNSFSGMNGSSFFDYLYLSYTTLLTMSFGDIIPVSGIAKLFVVLESVSSLVIGIILFFIFTTVILERYKKDISQLITKLYEQEKEIKVLMVQEFKLGIKELIQELSSLDDKNKNQPKRLTNFLSLDDDEIINKN